MEKRFGYCGLPWVTIGYRGLLSMEPRLRGRLPGNADAYRLGSYCGQTAQTAQAAPAEACPRTSRHSERGRGARKEETLQPPDRYGRGLARFSGLDRHRV